MLPEIPPEEFAAALDEVAGGVLASAGVFQPPVDAFQVARAIGLLVAEDDRQQGRARYVRLRRPASDFAYESHTPDTEPGQGSILLKPDPRQERRHWAVAHELGEHLAHEVFEILGVDPRETQPSSREVVANHLASRLLLPTAWLERDGPACNWDLTALKQHYHTASHESIARRMLGFSTPVIITICDHGRIAWRRSNSGRRAPPLGMIERRCWDHTHQTGNESSRHEEPLWVRAWAIHEPDWKREILRTEITETQDADES